MGESAHINGLVSSLAPVLGAAALVATCVLALLCCALYKLLGRVIDTLKRRRAEARARRRRYAFEAAIERLNMTRIASASDKAAACAICLDSFMAGEELRELVECSHRFHAQCIDKWILRSFSSDGSSQPFASCPLCKRSLDTLSSQYRQELVQ
jgi:hypothetical protein